MRNAAADTAPAQRLVTLQQGCCARERDPGTLLRRARIPEMRSTEALGDDRDRPAERTGRARCMKTTGLVGMIRAAQKLNAGLFESDGSVLVSVRFARARGPAVGGKAYRSRWV